MFVALCVDSDMYTLQVKVTKHHNEECKRLLALMGVPYIEVRPVVYAKHHWSFIIRSYQYCCHTCI